jgi:hypothetical protein
VWIAAITFFLRFRQGKWRSMRVIERDNEAGSMDPAVAVAD